MLYTFESRDIENNILYASQDYASEEHCKAAAAQYCLDEKRDVLLISGREKPNTIIGQIRYRNGTARWTRALKIVKVS